MTRFTYWSPRTIAGIVFDFLFYFAMGLVLIERFSHESTPVPLGVIVIATILCVVIRLSANIWLANSRIEIGKGQILFSGMEYLSTPGQFLTSVDRLVLRPGLMGMFPTRREVWFKNGKKLVITSRIRGHQRLVALLEEQTGKTFSAPGTPAEVSAS